MASFSLPSGAVVSVALSPPWWWLSLSLLEQGWMVDLPEKNDIESNSRDRHAKIIQNVGFFCFKRVTSSCQTALCVESERCVGVALVTITLWEETKLERCYSHGVEVMRLCIPIKSLH